MEKDVECGVNLRLDIFIKYWNILKRNYKDTQHNEDDLKMYYSIFKKFDEKDFVEAIEQVLLRQQYFPRIDEISKYMNLPKLENSDLPRWFDEEQEIVKASENELEELESIIKELGG